MFTAGGEVLSLSAQGGPGAAGRRREAARRHAGPGPTGPSLDRACGNGKAARCCWSTGSSQTRVWEKHEEERRLPQGGPETQNSEEGCTTGLELAGRRDPGGVQN